MTVTVYTDVDVWEVIGELTYDQRKRVFEDLAEEFNHPLSDALSSHPAEAEYAEACQYLIDRYSFLEPDISDTVVSIAKAAGYLG